jgi:uncharacterized membrane protein YeaQ/YmgE (transglycosylase-associated protein family)
MGIIAWIILGIGAGLLANMLIPGRRSQGLILTCLIGIAGALGGGWLATKIFHFHTLHGFFYASTWLTASAGAAVMAAAARSAAAGPAAESAGNQRHGCGTTAGARMGPGRPALSSGHGHCGRCRPS